MSSLGIHQFELCNRHGIGIRLMNWGATWLSCRVPVSGVAREILLGCASPADYFRQTAYLGATIGRYANRIGRARFSRDGKTWKLLSNQGAHQLHGGPEGFDKRYWSVLEHGAEYVRFGIESPDGDQGFPGRCIASVEYRLDALGVFIDYEAEVDAPCPVNLTNHAYFNLDGASGETRADILRQRLQIRAGYYVPTDAEAIPLGKIESVQNTSFDFNTMKAIGRDFLADEQQRQAGGYDHAFLLDATCQEMANPAATLIAGDGRLTMDLYTTQSSLQLYSGNYLNGVLAREGAPYRSQQGLALETQYLPDSPNHPEWPQPDCWLLPGQRYRHLTHLSFRQA